MRISATDIDALLPQTQCTRCGFQGCMPYAEALAAGEADINRCPPGGEPVIIKLSQLLNKPVRKLDPACGVHGPRRVALIDEANCIGCTLCIQACPVDAIAGAAKLMHTVVADLCTGCELCLPPCPVDCISMPLAQPEDADWTEDRAKLARQRHRQRKQRLARDQAARQVRQDPVAAENAADPQLATAAAAEAARRRAIVQQAIERSRARATHNPGDKPEHS